MSTEPTPTARETAEKKAKESALRIVLEYSPRFGTTDNARAFLIACIEEEFTTALTRIEEEKNQYKLAFESWPKCEDCGTPMPAVSPYAYVLGDCKLCEAQSLVIDAKEVAGACIMHFEDDDIVRRSKRIVARARTFLSASTPVEKE